jgi:hypothetical protein
MVSPFFPPSIACNGDEREKPLRYLPYTKIADFVWESMLPLAISKTPSLKKMGFRSGSLVVIFLVFESTLRVGSDPRTLSKLRARGTEAALTRRNP